MGREIVEMSVERGLIGSWLDALEMDCRSGDIAETSRKTYQVGMEKFFSRVLADGQYQISGRDVQRWKADLLKAGMKPSTVNTWLAGVRRFFAWAAGEGHLLVNPAAGVKGAKRKNTAKTHLRDKLTDREMVRVLNQPDLEMDRGKRDYAILCLKAYCALRDIEIHRADVEDISSVYDYPVLRVQGKGASEKNETAVIYHPTAQDAVYSWLAVRGSKPGALFVSMSDRSRGKRLSLSSIRHLVISYYRLAGIVNPRKTSHSMRHSAISKVALKGNILKARQVARHASIETTMIYVHEADRLIDPGEALIEYGE